MRQPEKEQAYRDLMLMDGSPRYVAAVARWVPGCKNLGDVYRVATSLFRELCDTDPSFARRDLAEVTRELRTIPRSN